MKFFFQILFPTPLQRLRLALCAGVVFALAPVASTRAADSSRAEPSGFSSVDLSLYAIPAEEPEARAFALLPKGQQTFNDVPFRSGLPVAVTGMEAARLGDFFPPSVTGIKIGRAAKRIHFLHATSFADKDGAPLAKIIFRYANGGEEAVRIGYGVHARSWITPGLEKRSELFDSNSRVAWTESDDRRGNNLRLFQTALENPKPAEVIAAIDIVSLFSHATPLIIAITLESEESKLPAHHASLPRKATRDMRELPDSAYRGELSVRVTDAESGAVLTNATATLSVTDDKESFYFGGTNTDAQGAARFPYPPQHAVGVSIWVHAPNRMPVVVSEAKTNVSKFAGNYSVALKRGTTIGGVVKSADGKAVAGAKVIISYVTRLSPHHYSRTDYDTSVTGADGKWTSHCLPTNLTGLNFQVEHPDYRPAFYATDGYAPPPTSTSSASSSTTSSSVTTRRLPDGTIERIVTPRVTATPRGQTVPLVTAESLRAASAEMILQPAILITGTALDAKSQPLANTEVIFQQNNPVSDRKYLRTDAQGKFRTMATAPGNGTFNLVMPGQSPKFVMASIQPGMAPIELKLSPPKTLRGRVMDRQQRPVPGARVRVDELQGTTDLVKFQALTDEQGTFVWTGAPSDQVTFYVSKTNYSSTRQSFSGAMENVQISITRTPGIYGKVFDAETKKPIQSFTLIPGRKYSSSEPRINWQRGDVTRGSGGEYSLRLSSYYFQPEARVLIEAPGYEPQISRAFNGIDSYTNDFALKRGQGVSGVVFSPDGAPVVGASLVIIEKGENGYLDNNSQVRGNNGSDLTRSDTKGKFEFAPKLDPDKVFVSHELGFAEALVTDLKKDGKITLQKWGHLKGTVKIGDSLEPGATVQLQKNYEPFGNSNDERPVNFSFSLKADPDADGNFVFEKVPPGEHRLAWEYKLSDERYESPQSHGFLVAVKAGATADATLGGTGRRVTGRVNLTGGTHSDIDWKRDVHRLVLALPPIPGQPGNLRGAAPQENEPLVFLGGLIAAAQPLNVEAMRERQRAERMYVLLFDTNGNFRVDNVPPGKYQLMLNVTDPEEEYYNRRSIGATSKEITVPDEKGAKVNAPFDAGAIDLTIRPRLRVGRAVSSFDAKTSDGKIIKLSDYRGRPVVLHFWGLSLGYNTTELNALKELQATYGQSGKLAILGCNLDADKTNAEQFAKRQGFTWTQTYLGQWNQTPIPGMFGINGNSACVLVDAEGKLASGQLRGSGVRSAVMNLLSGE